MLKGYPKHAHAIFHRAFEIDTRCFFEIFGGAGYFANVKFGIDNLRKHFVVENKIVVICIEIDGFEYFFAKRTIAGMIFRKFIIYE
jgi:hypothetical protein